VVSFFVKSGFWDGMGGLGRCLEVGLIDFRGTACRGGRNEEEENDWRSSQEEGRQANKKA
jgi:hypothetical protein